MLQLKRLADLRHMTRPVTGNAPVVVDNRALDGFMERFREKGCRDVECEACRWCHDFAAKAVRMDAEESRRALVGVRRIVPLPRRRGDVAVSSGRILGRDAVNDRFRLKAREWLDVPGRKRTFNERHFAEAASRYDVATRMMSLGRDAAWKRALVGALPDLPSPVCADLACGTGDVAFLLAGRYPGGVVTGIDLSAPMLEIARERNRYRERPVRAGRSVQPPVSRWFRRCRDRGLRPSQRPRSFGKPLDEVHRVLSPGGVAAFLDFSNPESPPLRHLQYLLLRGWCGLWGLLLHGTPEIHGYVAESLRVFPSRRRFREILREHRFERVGDRRFFLGITGLLVLRREGFSTMARVGKGMKI